MKNYILMGILLISSIVVGEPNPRFARISKMSGPAYILRSGLTEYEDAAVNMAIAEGDRIRTEDSYMRVQFDNGVDLNFDKQTEVEISSLSRDENEEEISAVYVLGGKVRVNVPRYYNAEKRFYIQTQEGGVALEELANAQVEAGKGVTRIIVYEGRGKALSNTGEISLLAGETTIIEKDKNPLHPEQYGAVKEKDFANWCAVTGADNVQSRKYVPDDIVVGVEELDGHGRWVHIDNYGWVWRPSVSSNWRPYYDGHWVFSARWGWTWVSYESWGWAPYHYGRWAYDWPYGWVWIPGRVWGPSWVCWSEEPGYIGWCPMGPDDRPWFHHSRRHHIRQWVSVDIHHFKNYKYKESWDTPNKPTHQSYKYKEVSYKNDTKWTKTITNIKPDYVKTTEPAKKELITPLKGFPINKQPVKSGIGTIPTKQKYVNTPEELNKNTIQPKPVFISRPKTLEETKRPAAVVKDNGIQPVNERAIEKKAPVIINESPKNEEKKVYQENKPATKPKPEQKTEKVKESSSTTTVTAPQKSYSEQSKQTERKPVNSDASSRTKGSPKRPTK
ncbi:MAG: FecR domain-containing protein [bacterium]|nr:FecR domain-containing protein [bacterium]